MTARSGTQGAREHLICRSGRTIQGCPVVAVCWPDVPGPSFCVGSWLWPWLPSWLQSRGCPQPERANPNRISSSRRRGSDSFLLDQRTPSVLRGLHRTALNCNPNCNLQIRRFLYRHPASFRSVRGLGLVNARCPYGSGAPEDCPSAWLSASLPADDSVTPWSSSPPPGLFPATWPRPVLSCPRPPPPNPIAAEPDGRRVLSRGGVADHEANFAALDHEVTPQAPLTGSGCREHSYGGFGGGHPHFLPHAPDLQIRSKIRAVQIGP
jgi:hypothetical protein